MSSLPSRPQDISPATSPAVPHSYAEIEDLPNEMLIEVLEYTHAAVTINVATFARDWFRLLRVCQRWRCILLSSPRFWRVILMGPNLEHLSRFVAQSVGVPADVYFRAASFLHPERPGIEVFHPIIPALILLHPILPTLRLIDLDLWSTTDFMRIVRQGSLVAFFSNHMPALQEVRITAPPPLLYAQPPDSDGYLRLDFRHFPSLRRLVFYGAIEPTDFSSLRSLHLERCEWSITFTRFLSILSKSPDMESMTFYYSRWWPHYETPDANRATIVLPRLRELSIVGANRFFLSAILQHIDTPNIKSINLESGAEGGPSSVISLFSGSQAAAWKILPKLTAPAAVVLSNVDCGYSICCRTPTELIEISLYPEVDNTLPSLLGGLVFLLAEPQLLRELTIHAEGLDDVLPAVWEEVLMSFGGITKLEVLDADGSFSALWNAFLRATDRLPPEHVCCPYLRTVRLARRHTRYSRAVHLKGGEELPTAMLEALQSRAERGARLQELTWEIPGLDDDAISRFCAELTGALSPLVSIIRVVNPEHQN